MTRMILLFTVTFLAPSFVVLAQQAQSAEDAAVKQTVQYYFDGWNNNDVSSMKKAFNSKAKWFEPTINNELAEIKIERVFAVLSNNAQRKIKRPRTFSRILAVDVTGETASVKVEFEYPDLTQGGGTSPETQQKIPGVKQTEYLSLIKFKDEWQIVGKVFFLQRTDTPTQQSVLLKY